jgi:NAD(P)-dependent dehydrogenase (short-subunit alcohol dehydrogenase family)
LGHFLLTELLLPLIRKSAELKHDPRIVIVSSEAHRYSPMNW